MVKKIALSPTHAYKLYPKIILHKPPNYHICMHDKETMHAILLHVKKDSLLSF